MRRIGLELLGHTLHSEYW